MENKLEVTEINEMEKTKKIVSNRHSVYWYMCVLVYVCTCALNVYEEKEIK